MIIKNFEDFNESYLKSGRGLIYHFTSLLINILDTDTLKISKSVVSTHNKEKAISFTRNIDFTDVSSRDFCLELDIDLLYINGYKLYPVDELGWKGVKIKKPGNYIKSNFVAIKNGKRGTKHNLNLPKEYMLETEFEERIYKNIVNLGKYITAIYMTKIINKDVITEYLNKYPHIKIYKVDDPENFRKHEDITHLFIKTHQKELEKAQ